ncbi:hypothetical protein GCM10027598_26570 [Amycolatopsis oliviviridis]|uniref:Lipoprotein n=1 Tax=Amycolatopsis oliviviridis TaxID=1471590 RepID=A0ABQ3LIS2_9PSEU|nr:hypothetical protein [Amycolatopsis oliviviridis]GHH17353.1 hypothetical protein GCM10017790_34220 [Amycolatopsis oliviviridis]
MPARRLRIGAIAALCCLVAGCDVEIDGAAGISAAEQQRVDRRAEQRGAVESALKELEQAPAVVYKSTIKDASGKPAELEFRITRNGSAHGALPVDGQTIQVISADKQLYLSASPEYWKAHGLGNSEQYGTNWVRTDSSDLPVNAVEALNPRKAASTLRTAVSAMNRLTDPVRSKLPDGTEVYDVGSGLGTLRVTTAAPHRVVSFAPSLVDAAGGKTLGAEMRVAPLAGDALKKLQTDLDGAIGGVGQPFDALTQVSVSVVDDKLDCTDFVGTCRATIGVANTVIGGASGTPVHLTLTVEFSAQSLGAQTCTADANAAPDTTTSMSCEVKFKLPNRNASYQVQAKPAARGEVRVPVDVNGVREKLKSEFATLGG